MSSIMSETKRGAKLPKKLQNDAISRRTTADKEI